MEQQLYMKPENKSKDYARLFLKEFIREGKDNSIPLNETYILYIIFLKSNYPSEKPITTTSYYRITTDYFYKKPGAKNFKAISLEQMKNDLTKKQTAIFRDMEILSRITKNRKELLNEEFT